MPDEPTPKDQAETEMLDLGIIKVTVPKFRVRDAVEMVVGTSVVAMPLAMTEEVWDLGEQLAGWRIMVIAVLSWGFIAAFIFSRIYRSDIRGRQFEYLVRVCAVYAVTLVVSAATLWAFDKFDPMIEPIVALKRVFIVAMPASFAATVVDSLR